MTIGTMDLGPVRAIGRPTYPSGIRATARPSSPVEERHQKATWASNEGRPTRVNLIAEQHTLKVGAKAANATTQ